MKQETRTAVYDSGLRLEAYRLQGITRPFPSHFHEYYVIGFLEDGARTLFCRNREYPIQRGHILLFNPGDSHACAHRGRGTLDYREFNIPQATMLDLAEAVTGLRELPEFSSKVVSDGEAVSCLRPLHELVLKRSRESKQKEEALLSLFSHLIPRYGRPSAPPSPERRDEIERACAFMERHFAQRIHLEEICRSAGLSKSALLRAFVRTKGVTPYRYLENLRIGRARQLLERGVPPVEAALRTGFSDQSHFTNCFRRFIGLSPGAYRDIFKDTEDSSYEK